MRLAAADWQKDARGARFGDVALSGTGAVNSGNLQEVGPDRDAPLLILRRERGLPPDPGTVRPLLGSLSVAGFGIEHVGQRRASLKHEIAFIHGQIAGDAISMEPEGDRTDGISIAPRFIVEIAL
ncbi:hypothetical protein [uncultured Hoeflea sp.]|uniref:hypothetical protein n=1 Tax=uncultured Hoeflea sp. TaxID=538666 RepID=UPI00260928FD|nr:hypothetical protein [uncultured Hoeflea sp.]